MEFNKQEIINEFKQSDNDTGSPEVQVALLTKRITNLTEHLKQNRQDHSTRRGLVNMVNRRRKLLAYLKRKSPERYTSIISKLKLRH